MNERPLEGRVVVIVGGTSGLGLSAARACIAAGGRVVCGGLSAEPAQSELAQQLEGAKVVVSDATAPDCAQQLIAQALENFGGFDALYHVAGGSGRKFGDGPLHEMTDTGIDYTVQLNLKSMLYSNRAAARSFLARKVSGTVLNMGSVLGFSPSPEFFSTHVYATCKAAVIGLTKSCAAYYAPYNIRFNAIAPGLVDTPMASRAMSHQPTTDYIRRKQPLDGGRAGTAEDLDAAVVYFLSDQSRFVTGQVIAIDGGWSVSEPSH